ncbi:winged helix-turn-helix transcriptional regulator [Rubrivivax sp. RP6-9]|uniref:winged helix-turn-helix transcriptional regulator n=1 Tax=Rubrivivax sp. RP6-9 TaxID=3415750 RepID=UPI003CC61A03
MPAIGVPARGSDTGRPIMVVFDLLGRRSALRVLWELRAGPRTFRALQAAAQTNPSLLNVRLHELRSNGLVEQGEGGYALTDAGRALLAALRPLASWAQAWGVAAGAASDPEA